jgi:hypothetical protein
VREDAATCLEVVEQQVLSGHRQAQQAIQEAPAQGQGSGVSRCEKGTAGSCQHAAIRGRSRWLPSLQAGCDSLGHLSPLTDPAHIHSSS